MRCRLFVQLRSGSRYLHDIARSQLVTANRYWLAMKRCSIYGKCKSDNTSWWLMHQYPFSRRSSRHVIFKMCARFTCGWRVWRQQCDKLYAMFSPCFTPKNIPRWMTLTMCISVENTVEKKWDARTLLSKQNSSIQCSARLGESSNVRCQHSIWRLNQPAHYS